MNSRSTTVDLRPDHLATVNAILIAEVPDYEVWAFGSRANWTARDSSDLDLAIASKEPVPVKRLRRLQRAFEESYLPLKVDVVDLSRASAEFRGLIERQHVVLRKPTDSAAEHSTDREWRSLPLEDALETLIDYRGKTPKKVTQGIPLITARIIKGGRIETPEEFISPDDYEGWMRRGIPRAGDVLLTTEAPLGEVAQLDERKVALAQRVVALRGKKGLLENDFLKYLLQSSQVQDQLKSRASGTTVQGIKQSELRKISLSVPPLDQQRAIAHTLGLLDRKIELNRRMNETLEAMAQALFKKLFVDGIPNALPEGWEIKSLGDLTDLITKGTTPTEENVAGAKISDTQTNYLRVNAIALDGSILDDKLMRIPESVHDGILRRSILRVGDVVYTIAGTIGRVALIEESVLPANCNQAIAIIRPRPGIPSGFLLLSMKQPVFQEELHSNIVHAVQANLSLGMLSRAKIISPPLQILSSLFRPVDDILRIIWANRSEVRTLATLRGALLPKLLSGELRIKDAQRIIGEQA
jgi:type I restriction enzyme S subunit